ncbi:hypothetical protein PQO01_12345 [Lentisphaera marina]|uniref:hypothetical protein n=1 Tax=Lentisphaera marina TaxID=1111041 RepID=UPI002365D3F0|nr:hypothetical protein [Lentisphaera marina]MDD7985742.1 hypothetical protein [Lentisphaera marina]
MKINNIIIAENSLENFSGHFFEYTNALWEYLRRSSCVEVLANKNVSAEIQNQVGARPHFSERFWFDPTLPDSIPRKLRRFYKYHTLAKQTAIELEELSQQNEVDSDTLIIFPTAVHNTVKAICHWLIGIKYEKRPKVVVVFHFALKDGDKFNPTTRYYKKALKMISQFGLDKNVYLFTDSYFLKAEYELITNLSLRVLPIPHTHWSESPRRDLNSLNIVYLGNARLEKGFCLLSDAISYILKNSKQNIGFEIQAGNFSGGANCPIRKEVDKLESISQVSIHDKALSSEAYEDLLARADIVLLPYVGNQYKSGTSGICCEAIASAKAIVVPANTWLEAQLHEFGEGESFNEYSAIGIAQATCKLIENYEALENRLAIKAEAYRKYHSVENYFTIMMQEIDET